MYSTVGFQSIFFSAKSPFKLKFRLHVSLGRCLAKVQRDEALSCLSIGNPLDNMQRCFKCFKLDQQPGTASNVAHQIQVEHALRSRIIYTLVSRNGSAFFGTSSASNSVLQFSPLVQSACLVGLLSRLAQALIGWRSGPKPDHELRYL